MTDSHTSKQLEARTKSTAVKSGAVAGFPIFLGYLPIAVAYGVLATQSGLSTYETTLMSVLVFAGAAQFMAANMFAQGAMFLQIVIATFVLNFRHFVMSMSFMNRVHSLPLRWKFGLSLGLTDETFAVSSLHADEVKKENSTYFYLSLILVAYFSWVSGSFLGAILGEALPPTLSESMGIALYAMFIGLLIPSVKKEWRIGLIALTAMVLNFYFIEVIELAQGWAIVLATILGSLLGIPLLKEEKS
ncbi:branched-chain amino acid transporter AzlC [Halalkalibacillus sediminis]|uniref:Branched-chain amino acid transporter AzlC n=1 Tax=Halalkalibacillus sediminis TaxID=2018042 RepID=A0A2I0QVV6_9BACI|nr:AzlC family ABC transporter permease [Halalkalibacillus sediminis]PKR78250.1 branched-chain amino acid transporter AzlC [Halalkalibacillus sediminis]